MGFPEHLDYMHKNKVKKKAVEKKVAPIPKSIDRIVEKPIAPIVKVIEHPNYAPMVEKQATMTAVLAEQAIASMRDSVNNNQTVMAEIVKRIAIRPKEFIIVRDGQQNMTKIIPVYE